jgi:Holliday junction resolvase
VLAARRRVSPYERGRRFEYRVLRDLRRRGFLAWRFPGSKPFDIFAVDRTGRAYIIECKVNRRDFTEEEREQLVALRFTHNVVTLLAWSDGGRIRYEEVA